MDWMRKVLGTTDQAKHTLRSNWNGMPCHLSKSMEPRLFLAWGKGAAKNLLQPLFSVCIYSRYMETSINAHGWGGSVRVFGPPFLNCGILFFGALNASAAFSVTELTRPSSLSRSLHATRTLDLVAVQRHPCTVPKSIIKWLAGARGRENDLLMGTFN